MSAAPTANKEMKLHPGPTRSSQANRFYWAAVVASLARRLMIGKSAAHELLKARFLAEPIIDPLTGEVVGSLPPKSTASLSTAAFAEYVGRCSRWLHDRFDIAIESTETGGLP
ncbi:hypothetical protein [Fontivita pretiosa]|uniref:hypothetical protein n=1 Tax=Fontivita pretiosa TaxID=2989684 RepID=UPI003D1716D2